VLAVARLPSDASDDDIAALINDSRFGLTAGVFSADRERAKRILRQAQVQTASFFLSLTIFDCCL
jgi:acyl-CoA reductase-like NAD-dependent aldehyde dehydrogenase